MGNFRGALAYLEPAVDLWPEEPAYQSGLAWALYKQPKSDPPRACEHLEIAHRQSPEDAQILLRLGIVTRVLGDQNAAEAMIERARQIDPSVSE